MASPEQEQTSVSTTEIGRPNGKLVLPGAGSTEATVEVIYQSHATRMSRALITLAVAVLMAPVLFFLPPHFLWPIVAIAIGGWLAWRYWTGEYYVTHFEGTCPRCDTPIEMRRGTRIRGEHTLDCHGCHRHPTLIVNDPEAPTEEGTETGVVIDEASDRRGTGDRRSSDSDRRGSDDEPTPAPEMPAPALDEPARRPDELGG